MQFAAYHRPSLAGPVIELGDDVDPRPAFVGDRTIDRVRADQMGERPKCCVATRLYEGRDDGVLVGGQVAERYAGRFLERTHDVEAAGRNSRVLHPAPTLENLNHRFQYVHARHSVTVTINADSEI